MVLQFTGRETRTSRGFTLIELMIALVLGLLMIGATVTVFLSNQQTSRTKTELGNTQETFRFASQTIMRVVQQGSIIRDPGNNLLRVETDLEDGKVDCLGRPVVGVYSVVSTFFINDDGEFLCHVVAVLDSDGTKDEPGTTVVLGVGLDAENSKFTFGVADVAEGYWKKNTAWGEAGDVDADAWRNVRSVRVQLAKQAGGEAIGAIGMFSATMRCAALGC